MKKENLLIERLLNYNSGKSYPFHMPGHKRKGNFPNPFTIDITEIDGFDNLHHPEGILKYSMDWAADIYGAQKTYYLVNGSSCGILSAISASVNFGGNILIGRNSHKSVYHAVFLNHLKTNYVYPQNITGFNINGGLSADDIEKVLITEPNIEAVFIVSPTYDGIVSDIKTIADVVHRFNIPLIVDEAHGAHFSFGNVFPESALKLGADIVIQSVHKTLPSLTQTAVMHVKSDLVDNSRLEYYLNIYQSSSPSYLLIASIEYCIFQMNQISNEEYKKFIDSLCHFYRQSEGFKYFKLLEKEFIGKYSVFDIDPSKLVINCSNSEFNGIELSYRLRKDYYLEMEMCSKEYVLGIASVFDSDENLVRLLDALKEIDQSSCPARKECEINYHKILLIPDKVLTISKAINSEGITLDYRRCKGRVSKEFVYLYPPGIPFIVPGEIIDQEMIDFIKECQSIGLSVQGTADKKLEYLQVVK